jgi:hypothetical protein
MLDDLVLLVRSSFGSGDNSFVARTPLKLCQRSPKLWRWPSHLIGLRSLRLVKS